jgi:hypothetical protein
MVNCLDMACELAISYSCSIPSQKFPEWLHDSASLAPKVKSRLEPNHTDCPVRSLYPMWSRADACVRARHFCQIMLPRFLRIHDFKLDEFHGWNVGIACRINSIPAYSNRGRASGSRCSHWLAQKTELLEGSRCRQDTRWKTRTFQRPEQVLGLVIWRFTVAVDRVRPHSNITCIIPADL